VSLEKSNYSVFYSKTSSFGSFRVKPRKKLDILRHGKRLRSIKEPRWKKSKPKAKAVKTGLFGLGY
jgi:hypothetical protein